MTAPDHTFKTSARNRPSARNTLEQLSGTGALESCRIGWLARMKKNGQILSGTQRITQRICPLGAAPQSFELP
jgi:hypothetical protein